MSDRAKTPIGTIAKAAIVMMALDEERLQRVMERLDHEEILQVSRAMAGLGRTDPDTVAGALAEFRDEVSRTSHVMGTMETTERLLRRMLPPERADVLIGEIRGFDGRTMWQKLATVPPEVLAGFLQNEYPQTACVILARLPAPHAARVLRLLPPTSAEDITLRMVRLDSVQRSVLGDIEETLRREFVATASRSLERDRVLVMAEMLNRCDRETAERVIRMLEEKEPDAAARIRRAMFTFEDLARVDPSTLGVLVAECRADRLQVALSGVSRELCELLLSSMSERAANMLRGELDSLPPQRRRSIEEAQAEIITIAKRLAEEGRIFILGDEDEAPYD